MTDDKKVIDYIKDARLLGVCKDTDKRYSGKRSWEFDVVDQGWRYHMSNINAAIGISQLNKFSVFERSRKKLAKEYDKLFKNNDLIIPLNRDYDNVVPHIYVVVIKGMKDRKFIMEKMLQKGIQVGFHYFPNHLLSFYHNDNILPLKITEKLYTKILTLPLHPDLSINDINYIYHNLNSIINEQYGKK